MRTASGARAHFARFELFLFTRTPLQQLGLVILYTVPITLGLAVGNRIVSMILLIIGSCGLVFVMAIVLRSSLKD